MNSVSSDDNQTSGIHYAVTKESWHTSIPLLRWWYRVSGPEDVPESANFLVREATRRSRIASLIMIGILCSALFLIPLSIFAAPNLLQLPSILIGTTVGILCCLLALPFNRHRQIQAVGILLILSVNIIIASVVLSEREGLDPLFLSMFDLLVVSELVAASLLAPVSVFWVAVLNMIEVILDINVQSRSMMWMQMIPSQQLTYSLLARPAILFFVVALVAYLWVKSAFNALQRADRAELIANLEQREKERVQQLEESIEQMLAVHMRVANGDLSARAPAYQSFLLWRIGAALNNFLARLQVALAAERDLRRLTQEITQLRLALRTWRRGQPLQWYSTKETLLNPLVNDLRYLLAREQLRPSLQEKMQKPFNPITPLPPSVDTRLYSPRPQVENER